MSQLPRSIHLTGVTNARELGGIPAAGGRKVRNGLLLRTGALCDGTADDLRRLEQVYHLAWVADFRTLKEAMARPDPPSHGTSFYHLLVIDESRSDMGAATGSVASHGWSADSEAMVGMARRNVFGPEAYCELLFTAWGLESYRAFFDLALKNDGEHALLFHCSAGKDRTGIGGVLLLSALGAEREAAVADYVLTNEYVAHDIARVEEYARTHYPQEAEALLPAIRSTVGVAQVTMDRMLDEIDARYGSMDAFLAGPMGLNSRKLDQLRAIYLE